MKALFSFRRSGAAIFGWSATLLLIVLGAAHLRLREAYHRAINEAGTAAPAIVLRPVAVTSKETAPVRPSDVSWNRIPASEAEPATDPQWLMRLALTVDPAARIELLKREGIRIGFQDFQVLQSGASVAGLRSIFPALLATWSPGEARQAMDWVIRLPDSQEKSLLLPALLASPALDPALILQQITAMPDNNPMRGAILSMALNTLKGRDPAAAAHWLDSLSEEDPMRASMIPSLVQTWMRSDPAAAAAWVGRMKSGQTRDQAYMQIAMATAQTSPQTAMEWCQSIELEPIRKAAVNQVMAVWAVRDPEAATSAAMSVKEGPEYDQMVLQMASQMAASNSVEAAVLAETISNPGMRMGAIMAVTYQWGRRDPEGARQWAESLKDANSRAQALRALEQIGRRRQSRP